MIKFYRTNRHGLGPALAEWESMTVADVIGALQDYPQDAPVLMTWEGVLREVDGSRFTIERPDGFDRDVLVVDAE